MGENSESNMLENNVQQKTSPEEITHPKVTSTHTRKISTCRCLGYKETRTHVYQYDDVSISTTIMRSMNAKLLPQSISSLWIHYNGRRGGCSRWGVCSQPLSHLSQWQPFTLVKIFNDLPRMVKPPAPCTR